MSISFNQKHIQDMTEFRHALHSDPELSEQEYSTSNRILNFLKTTKPTLLLSNLGHMQTGVCALYSANNEGPQILLRCELDALPIIESNDLPYKSKNSGVSHKCGHDGHMASMCLFAKYLSDNLPQKGSVALLFQPAEENGEGAKAVLNDETFKKHIRPDYVFGFHNIPKYKKHQILIRSGVFSSASAGFIIQLTGTSTHSSYPENGRSPSLAVSKLIEKVNTIANTHSFEDKVVTTISYAQLGSADLGPNFGTAPGKATVMGIVRAFNDKDFDHLKALINEYATEAISDEQLELDLTWHEEFPVTYNNSNCTEIIKTACENNNIEVIELDEPFRWSEDFSYFTKKYKSSFFGIGSGLGQPQLHNELYDYPDDLIPTGAEVFKFITDEIFKIEEEFHV